MNFMLSCDVVFHEIKSDTGTGLSSLSSALIIYLYFNPNPNPRLPKSLWNPTFGFMKVQNELGKKGWLNNPPPPPPLCTEHRTLLDQLSG